MDALYHQTNRILQEVTGQDLGRIERLGEDPSREYVEAEVERKLEEVQKCLFDLIHVTNFSKFYILKSLPKATNHE